MTSVSQSSSCPRQENGARAWLHLVMSLTFLDTPGTPPWSHISHPDHHRHKERENPMESLAARDQGAMAAA